MWIHFLLENAHFAVNLFAALVFFAVFWLYFDAWQAKKRAKETVKLAGFLLLTVSFIAQAVVVESTIVQTGIIAGIAVGGFASWLRVGGYALLVIGLLSDPLENEPSSSPVFVMMVPVLSMLQPVLAVLVALLYLRRATVGLEDHLKPLAYGFGLLAVVELLSMHVLFESTPMLSLFAFVSPFGPVWIARHVLLLVVSLYICRWVFGYLLKQFQAQLFMVYTTTILAVFLITTVSFTGLLLRNMETEAQRQIETDVKVLDYAITSQKDQHIADAQSVALDPVLFASLDKSDRKSIGDIATQYLLAKHFSTFLVVSETGQVLARGEDRDRIGEAMGQDPLMKRGLLGESVATIEARDGVVAPDLSIRAVAPVHGPGGAVIGAVLVGKSIDTAFVDGMKQATGLDASIYGGNTVSATTFTAAGGSARLVGMKEEHAAVKKAVLTEAKPFSGSIPVRETVYTAGFLPLLDIDRNPVGMLFVGRPQLLILQVAGQSIQYTFLITVFLIIASVFPAYWIARYIARQLG